MMGRIWKMKWRGVKLYNHETKCPETSLSFLLHVGPRGGSCTDSRITQHPARTLDQDKPHPGPLLCIQKITCLIEVLNHEKTKLETMLILKSPPSSKANRSRSLVGIPLLNFDCSYFLQTPALSHLLLATKTGAFCHSLLFSHSRGKIMK